MSALEALFAIVGWCFVGLFVLSAGIVVTMVVRGLIEIKRGNGP